MKSYTDSRGNVVPGVTILESILDDTRKTKSLMSVLEHFGMRVVPEAHINNKKTDWIVPVSW